MSKQCVMSYHFILKNTLSYELFSNDVFLFSGYSRGRQQDGTIRLMYDISSVQQKNRKEEVEKYNIFTEYRNVKTPNVLEKKKMVYDGILSYCI